jgi:hypothetical protein
MCDTSKITWKQDSDVWDLERLVHAILKYKSEIPHPSIIRKRLIDEALENLEKCGTFRYKLYLVLQMIIRAAFFYNPGDPCYPFEPDSIEQVKQLAVHCMRYVDAVRKDPLYIPHRDEEAFDWVNNSVFTFKRYFNPPYDLDFLE